MSRSSVLVLVGIRFWLGLTGVAAVVALSLVALFTIKYWPVSREAFCIYRMLSAPVLSLFALGCWRMTNRRGYVLRTLCFVFTVASVLLCAYVIAFMLGALRTWPEFCVCGC